MTIEEELITCDDIKGYKFFKKEVVSPMDKMNCIWLNEQNPYDMLCRVQDAFNRQNAGCVLEALTLQPVKCPERHDMTISKDEHCHTCIMRWMTEKGRRSVF